MRLIDADKLKNELRKFYDMVLHQNISDDEKLAKHDILSDVMTTINEQPTIDNIYFNNKDILKMLYSFTFRITGGCPSEYLDGIAYENECPKSGCVYCWRKALAQRIKQLEEKDK